MARSLVTVVIRFDFQLGSVRFTQRTGLISGSGPRPVRRIRAAKSLRCNHRCGYHPPHLAEPVTSFCELLCADCVARPRPSGTK